MVYNHILYYFVCIYWRTFFNFVLKSTIEYCIISYAIIEEDFLIVYLSQHSSLIYTTSSAYLIVIIGVDPLLTFLPSRLITFLIINFYFSLIEANY